MYELFDHTADIGVRARAAALGELIRPCTDALYEILGEVVTAGVGTPRRFELRGDEPALLLRDYLGEALLAFEQERCRVVVAAVPEFTPSRLVVVARLDPVDAGRSCFHREIKAVTYHELAIREVAGGFEATYIVDI